MCNRCQSHRTTCYGQLGAWRYIHSPFSWHALPIKSWSFQVCVNWRLWTNSSPIWWCLTYAREVCRTNSFWYVPNGNLGCFFGKLQEISSFFYTEELKLWWENSIFGFGDIQVLLYRLHWLIHYKQHRSIRLPGCMFANACIELVLGHCRDAGSYYWLMCHEYFIIDFSTDPP